MQVQRQHDPTLPAPWEALFDPASGLKYYWNPQTNVTQYERPLGGPAPPPLAPASYVRPHFSPACPRIIFCEVNCGNMPGPLQRTRQPLTLRWTAQAANGNGLHHASHASQSQFEEPAGHVSRHVPPAGRQNFQMTCEEYRREHGLVVQGASVPDPLQTFESVGFPSNIMDEVYSQPIQAPSASPPAAVAA